MKGIFVFATIGVTACYLLVCILPYINTAQYWYFAFFGLVFPFLLAALLMCLFIWAFARSGWFWFCLIVLLCGTQQILASFGLNLPKDFNPAKAGSTLRVVQWNVTNWDQNPFGKTPGSTYRPVMIDLVKKQNADILCFQEFLEPLKSKTYDENISEFEKMGYRYHYFVSTITFKKDFQTGVTILSKFPIVDSAQVSFGENAYAENLIYTDIKVNDKVIRVITIHLQSVRFNSNDYESLEELKNRNEEGLKDSRTILSKLKKGYTQRYSQAEKVSAQIEKSPYPVILCGDFNDVPNSNTYFKIRGNLQDAFLEKGFLLGRSFRFISPTLRIDYIMADKSLPVQQVQTIRVPYSDHYPVVADLQVQ